MLFLSYLKPITTTMRMFMCVCERERKRERERKNNINDTYSLLMFGFVCVGANVQSV